MKLFFNGLWPVVNEQQFATPELLWQKYLSLLWWKTWVWSSQLRTEIHCKADVDVALLLPVQGAETQMDIFYTVIKELFKTIIFEKLLKLHCHIKVYKLLLQYYFYIYLLYLYLLCIFINTTRCFYPLHGEFSWVLDVSSSGCRQSHPKFVTSSACGGPSVF